MTRIDPHADESIETAGAPPAAARGGAVMLHGRGDSPAGILRLLDEVHVPGVHYVAPAAAGRVWFPGSLTDPVTERRLAFLESALDRVAAAMALLGDVGVAPEETVLVGFSQGAAVALEFATRRPRRFGGLVSLAGGLLGPTDDLAPRDGGLDGTPGFCGVGDADPHLSATHVEASAAVVDAMGGATTVERYPGLGHAINDDEIAALTRFIRAVRD